MNEFWAAIIGVVVGGVITTLGHLIIHHWQTANERQRDEKRKAMLTRMFGKEPVSRVNVDEAVALGAAIQAGMIMSDSGMIAATPQVQQRLAGSRLSDVAPHSFGTKAMIEAHGVMKPRNDIIIKKNTPIPTNVTNTYFTMGANQESIECWVTQGEDEDLDLDIHPSHDSLSKIIYQGYKEIIDIDKDPSSGVLKLFVFRSIDLYGEDQTSAVLIMQINSEDFTFGYSLNSGIEKAEGKYIILISAHTYCLDNKPAFSLLN